MAWLSSSSAALKQFKQRFVRTRLERLLWYAATLDLFLVLLRFLFRALHFRWSNLLDSAIAIFTLGGGFALILMIHRWLRRKVLWRLRNRLIVTYIYIGVIPVLLLISIGLIAAYLFAGQFATFVVSIDLHSELKALDSVNSALADSMAAQLRSGVPPAKAFESLQPAPGSTLTAWIRTPNDTRNERSDRAVAGTVSHSSAEATGMPGRWEFYVSPPGSPTAAMTPTLGRSPNLKVIAGTGASIALRTVSRVAVPLQPGQLRRLPGGSSQLEQTRNTAGGSEQLTLISSRAFNTEELRAIAADLGEVTLYAPDLSRKVNPESVPRDSVASIDLGDGSKRRGGDSKSPAPQSIRISKEQGKNVVYLSSSDNSEVVQTLPPIVAGSLPPPGGFYDDEVVFATPLEIVDWETGKTFNALLKVRTRPSMLYHRLFVVVGEFADVTLVALAVIAVFFAVIELVALTIGISLTRTITGSVAALYDATVHINSGDFAHRIAIRSDDQLAALEGSFNTMSASLERLLAEQKEKQRMESELAIAREVQSQLFPNQVPVLASLELFGVCRPARTVSGDYYDFLPLGSEKLGIAVGDISGKGISAALLMASIHSAVRVYDFGHLPVEDTGLPGAGEVAVSSGVAFSKVKARAELSGQPAPAKPLQEFTTSSSDSGDSHPFRAAGLQSPATLMALLNHHLFCTTPPEKYATLFLAVWDGATRFLHYCNAGHLAPLIMSVDGSVRKLEVGGTAVGLFDQMTYQEGVLEVAPGDLFIAYSDGITEPENEFGEFGDSRLLDLVRAHRDQPLERISDAVISAVKEWIGPNQQPDDLTLVLARAR